MNLNGSEWGATVVITHHVREGYEAAYEAWLDEIGPLCRSYPGNLDLQVIRPVPGLTVTSTVVIRFDTHEHLKGWMESADRKRLIEKIRPLLAKDDTFHVRSGLEFWFAPEGSKARVPVRWKQFLITWSAIYPLGMAVTYSMAPALERAGVSNHYLAVLLISGVTVWLMVYVVMPHYTRLFKHWLYR